MGDAFLIQNIKNEPVSSNIGFEAAFTSSLPTPDSILDLTSYQIANTRLQIETTLSTWSNDPLPHLGWNVEWEGDFEGTVDHVIETYSTYGRLYAQHFLLILEDESVILIGARDAWADSNYVQFIASAPGQDDIFLTGYDQNPPINANGTYIYKVTRINGTLKFYTNGTLYYTSTETYNQNVVEVRLTTSRLSGWTSPSANYKNLYFGTIR